VKMSIKEWFPPKVKRTVKQQIVFYISMLLLMVCFGVMGAFAGYYQGTGEYPFARSEAVLPDVPGETTTLVDVGHFLERDKTNEIDYGLDFNCVESAFLTARNATWEGLPARAGALVYEDGSGHVILIFPTSDDGWVFVDTVEDLVINPRVGAIYHGNRIAEILILEMRWIPFEVSK